jgi:hypothetical protein
MSSGLNSEELGNRFGREAERAHEIPVKEAEKLSLAESFDTEGKTLENCS